MTNQDQLQWEARLRRPAAAAAFAAGLMLLAGTVALLTLPEDRRGVDPRPDFLLSVNDSPGTLVAAVALQAVAALCLIFVFYYLFRAIIHRNPEIPRWFVYLIFLGPALYVIAQLISAFVQIDVAGMFADRDYSFTDVDPDSNLLRCPAIRGELGEDCANELLSRNSNGVAIALSLAGSVCTAFLFVMLPLRARRVGLLSPFMGILGVIAGVLFVLPILPGVPVVLQAFWLGALGALFLGNWPGGRGPAWESGEAEPWPTPAGRRGLLTGGGGGAEAEPEAANEPGPNGAPEPEPVPERPSSRKRKRKR